MSFVGECLRNLGVVLEDSRDDEKLKRFFPFKPIDHIIPGEYGRKDGAYYEYTKWEEKSGTACCSDSAISFHYITPQMFYVMYYLIYHLRFCTLY